MFDELQIQIPSLALSYRVAYNFTVDETVQNIFDKPEAYLFLGKLDSLQQELVAKKIKSQYCLSTTDEIYDYWAEVATTIWDTIEDNPTLWMGDYDQGWNEQACQLFDISNAILKILEHLK